MCDMHMGFMAWVCQCLLAHVVRLALPCLASRSLYEESFLSTILTRRSFMQIGMKECQNCSEHNFRRSFCASVAVESTELSVII